MEDFSSIRTREIIKLNSYEKINLKVIGDGNTYQIRIKDNLLIIILISRV